MDVAAPDLYPSHCKLTTLPCAWASPSPPHHATIPPLACLAREGVLPADAAHCHGRVAADTQGEEGHEGALVQAGVLPPPFFSHPSLHPFTPCYAFSSPPLPSSPRVAADAVGRVIVDLRDVGRAARVLVG